MSEKVVDLDLRRLNKALTELESSCTKVGQSESVPIIACAACSNGLFQLAHDRRIICATCHNEIAGIWWDDHGPKPAA